MTDGKSQVVKASRFDTRIDVPEKTRDQMIELLNQELADVFDLYSQTKQAHWNVKGTEFFQLHELFDDMAEELLGFADEIAERATAFGGEALGTVRMAASTSRLAEYPREVFDGRHVLEALADRYASLAETTREAVEISEEVRDMGTSDLFIEVVRGLDKRLWFLEAHLQE